jgi:hypothetical protein
MVLAKIEHQHNRSAPMDPDKLQELSKTLDHIESRMDAFMSRRALRDAEKAQRRADKAKRDAECLEPAELALNASTPEAPPNNPPEPRDLPDLWYGDNEDRAELRQGSLSKSN